MLIPHCCKQVSNFIYSYTSRLPDFLFSCAAQSKSMYRKVDKAIYLFFGNFHYKIKVNLPNHYTPQASEWIVIAIDYFHCALFSTLAGNEVFAIPRRSPFPNFPLLCVSSAISPRLFPSCTHPFLNLGFCKSIAFFISFVYITKTVFFIYWHFTVQGKI